ncbi:MAG TPA: sigma factor-like helix-turn-helix DNA-binding protein [Candidatus Atribacteria bacterium]|nr:sigma factor-like helix-turn-helix DNA-binding protein [Candidatus Atribacteria bacterium]HPT77822.1 sigma factor-like helix-turn-helix DNA-binding protein [Candidatus Atribacteria bacterium]
MDKRTEMALLLDLYGELLTDKQRLVLDQYYNYDLSLQEIADNVGISKQGVYDILKRSEHTLSETEEKLKLLEKLGRIRAALEKTRDKLVLIRDRTDNEEGDMLDTAILEIGDLVNNLIGG